MASYPEPFTFGIALIPRASARNWPLVEALLDLTLTSVRAQTDPDFRVIIAGHDRPRTAVGDPRVTFVEADWPVQEPGPHNADSGRKKYAINELVLERGGGLLMFLDADDWVDARLVAAARAAIGPDQVGALIDAGSVVDFQTLRAAALPHPRVFDGEFHRVCGSSAVARLRPDAADPLRRDPWNVLRSHHQWIEAAREHGAELVRLSVSGGYVINTSENHSEIHGPYAAWRRALTECANREGNAIDGAFAARFGLSLDRIRAASERFFPRVNFRWQRPTLTAVMPATVLPDGPPAAHKEGESTPSNSPCPMSGRPVSPPPDASRVTSRRPTFGPGLPAADRHGRRIVLVAAMRNERPHILEWVAYHLAIGFTDIVIGTNDCLGASPLLLKRLQELGPVTHLAHEVGPEEKPQLVAYRRAEDLPVVHDADRAMVLDADKFLNVHVGGGTVSDLLDTVPDVTAFVLNWRVFGNSGHEAWRPGFVCERFTRAAALGDAVNLSFKTLFTKIDAYRGKLLPHGPGYADEARPSELRYVNGAGAPLSNCFATSRTFLQSEPGSVSWELAQVNHYNTRPWDDYLAKHRRGGGVTRSWDRDWNWVAFNKNDETDLTILNKLPAARAIFRALLGDDALRRRHERCYDLYRGHVAALKRRQRSASADSVG